jgi:hypothetical protein
MDRKPLWLIGRGDIFFWVTPLFVDTDCLSQKNPPVDRFGIIAESTTLALRIRNDDITGFFGLAILPNNWSYVANLH